MLALVKASHCCARNLHQLCNGTVNIICVHTTAAETLVLLTKTFTSCSLFVRLRVSSALSKLFKEAMSYSGSAVFDWLYVVPLYHFMNGDCKPYTKLDYSAKIGARVEDPDLNLKRFKTKIPLG